jgi:hypothetical protein
MKFKTNQFALALSSLGLVCFLTGCARVQTSEYSHDEAARWAANNGFRYHGDGGSGLPENAHRLHAFHEYDKLSNHISGRFLGRDFHQVDVFRYLKTAADGDVTTEATALVLPVTPGSLPAFAFVPRSLTWAAEWLGVEGLAISTDADTPPALARVIEEVKKHYQVHSGGFGEAIQEAARHSRAPAPDPAVFATICKPEVLGFLSRHPGWFIESQGGLLAMWKPGRVMSGDERSEALALANEIMNLFDRADAMPAIPGVEVTNPFKVKRVVGTVVGAFVGFFAGAVISIALLFFVNQKLILLLPVLALLGVFVGGLLGAMTGRAKSPAAAP